MWLTCAPRGASFRWRIGDLVVKYGSEVRVLGVRTRGGRILHRETVRENNFRSERFERE